jgi:hypothetical protein
MTNQRIIHPTPEGGLAVIIPAPECQLLIDELARKDVPAGTPFKIITVNDLPADRDFRGAWEADFSEPDGHGIGADAWFAEQEAAS